jgi:hypothetical protein
MFLIFGEAQLDSSLRSLGSTWQGENEKDLASDQRKDIPGLCGFYFANSLEFLPDELDPRS